MSLAPHSVKTLSFRPGHHTGCAVEGDSLIFTGFTPRLSGATEEALAFGDYIELLPDGALLRGQDTLAGVLTSPEGLPIEQATGRVYARLLDLTEGLHLHRIWNFVPHINTEVDGIENYRAFNAGRHQIFSSRWGASMTTRLPAASALGTAGGVLAVAFSSSVSLPVHFENPLQEPAILYPRMFGAFPPAFARASRVHHSGQCTWHISGTSSVRGFQTQGSDIHTQFSLTIENIVNLCSHMKVPAQRKAAWKVFLRHPQDLAHAETAFALAFPQDAATAMFLHAEICRADLLVEIEGRLSVVS